MTPHYPGANRRIQYFAGRFTGALMHPNVVVLHTTEGGGWPSYSGGATAPNLTIRANKRRKRLEIRQHYPLNRSSRALQNKLGGVETNTLNVIQIELVGSCDRRDGYGAIYWPDAPDWCYRELGKVLATLHDLYPAIPLQAATLWLPYPASYGWTRARMSDHEWRNFYGICGHQHVPENDHGDPGDLPIDRILTYAIGDDDMPFTEKELRTMMREESEASVQKYLGDVVDVPDNEIAAGVGRPGNNKIAVRTALTRVMRNTRDILNGERPPGK